jgi:beta-glucosidase
MCNNQEANRFFSNSAVNERTIREIYLKGFEICVKKPVLLRS